MKLAKYILQNSKNKQKNLKYDFMPELLEIIERPSHVAGKVIVITISCLLLFSIIWAKIAHIDVVINGSGYITTVESACTITSNANGCVKHTYVANGDYVEKGEVLFELDTSQIELEIDRLEKQLKLLKEQKESVINMTNQLESYTNELLYTIEMNICNYESELLRQQLELEQMIVKAPIAGNVMLGSGLCKGQMVQKMQQVLVITPSEIPFIFQCYINNKDIADINIGDKVLIKLSAYSYSDYGAIEGNVTYISPYATVTDDGNSIYEIKIEIDETNCHKDVELKSGMAGTVEVNIGKRSILDYFLDPILGSLNNSLKEK